MELLGYDLRRSQDPRNDNYIGDAENLPELAYSKKLTEY